MNFATLTLFLSFLVTQTSSSIGVKAAKGINQPLAPNHAPAYVLGKNVIRFTKCRHEQKEVIKNAVIHANKRIKIANLYFKSHSYNKRGNVYTKYFGKSSRKDYQAVLLRFRKMAKRVTLVNYDCQPCTQARMDGRDVPPTYFTDDNGPTVRLCYNFWEQPGDRILRWMMFRQRNDKKSLTKFQAGWIIHALSQSGDIKGKAVESFYWDKSNAKGFARENPARVARSADNYMYL